MTRISIAAIAFLALAGCKTTEQLAAIDDAKCLGLGAKPGSEIYVQCRMMAEQTRVQKQIAYSQSQMAAQQAYQNTVTNMQRTAASFNAY